MPTDAEQFWNANLKRRLEWREDTGGCCIVLRPRLGEGRIGRWVAGHLRDPYYRIRLDAVGSFVWKACDGETSLRVIAEQMRRHFGKEIEPAEHRLGRFVQTMLRSRLITTVVDIGS